jgi:hypothetical protein
LVANLPLDGPDLQPKELQAKSGGIKLLSRRRIHPVGMVCFVSGDGRSMALQITELVNAPQDAGFAKAVNRELNLTAIR